MARDRSRSPPRKSARYSEDNDYNQKYRYRSPEPSSRRNHEKDRRDEGYDDDDSRRRRRRDNGEEPSKSSRDYRDGRDDRDERRSGRHDRREDYDHNRSRKPSPPRQSYSPQPPRERSTRPKSRSRSHSRSRSKSPHKDKGKPNFEHSGLLAAETKTVQNADGTKTVLKYHEPPEARKPLLGWRLYVFKGSEQVDLLHIYRQSAYLIGRDKFVVDIPIDHPSCSKQHAVIQFRQVPEKNEYGAIKQVIKPFIIDLDSTNGTHVNGDTIPASRYYELKLNDMIKFGQSAREYVLLHDGA